MGSTTTIFIPSEQSALQREDAVLGLLIHGLV